MFKKYILGLFAPVIFSSSVFSNTINYVSEKNIVNASVTSELIKVEICVDRLCKLVLEDKIKVQDYLMSKTEYFRDGLDDIDSLLKIAKKQYLDSGSSFIEDENSNKKYVMLSLLDGKFNLPVDVERFKNEDLSIVQDALESTLENYDAVLTAIKSETLPEYDPEDFDVINLINNLFYITQETKIL